MLAFNFVIIIKAVIHGPLSVGIKHYNAVIYDPLNVGISRPWLLSWMRIQLETRRSRVQSPPSSATSFHGDRA